jgi:hypothetical protein
LTPVAVSVHDGDMPATYELIDTKNPKARGMRFKSLPTARRELAASVPAGRFILIDRETRTEVR